MDFGAISHQDMVFYFFTKPFHFGVPLFPGDGVQRRRHMKKVVFVVSGGELGDPTFLREQAATKTPAAVICADGGARHVEAAGIIPVLIVGDMDSLDAQRQAYYEAKGCRIVCHPRRKDETDTELALHEAFRMEPAEIWIWGALGHRVDHVLANIFLLVQGKQKGIEVKLIDEWCEVFLIDGRTVLEGEAGQTVSLFPFWGPAAGITLTGFEFPLTNAVMEIGRPYGVSNRLMAGRGIIELGSGCLLAVRYFRPGIFPGEATE
jgi:thiamine pyrophosphokinase